MTPLDAAYLAMAEDEDRRLGFYERLADGEMAQQIWTHPLAEQLPVEGRRAARIQQTIAWGGGVAALLAAGYRGQAIMPMVDAPAAAKAHAAGVGEYLPLEVSRALLPLPWRLHLSVHSPPDPRLFAPR